MCRNINLISVYLEKFYLIVFFILLKNITTIGYHVDTHRLAKRMDLELCLDNFEVHRDTIIRTEESQKIGGKFLQGTPIGTLELCQRLCCERESCDVYIFEEKEGGYCYLFECGPPYDFHCKFTRHANYTSAFLTQIRHATYPPPTLRTPSSQSVSSSILQSGQQHNILTQSTHSQLPVAGLSQHELELTNLKQKSDMNSIGTQQGRITSTLLPPLGVRIGEEITTPKSTQSMATKCGRFQFACHSGECIAVYNACDGIPQCEDGSDEGPECPASSGLGIKSSSSLMNIKNSNMDNIEMLQTNRMSQGDVMMPIQKQSSIQTVPRQYQQQQIQPPIINNREDPMSSPPIWPNHKSQDAIMPDLEHNSHIFSHKGGIQIATNNVQQYPNQAGNMYNSIQRDVYMQPDIQGSYRNPIIQPQDHIILAPNVNWPQQPLQQPQQPILSSGPYVMSVNGQPIVNGQSQVKAIPIPQQQTPIQTISVQTKTNPETINDPKIPSTEDANMKKEESSSSNKNNNSKDSDEYTDYEDKSTEPPKKKQRKHKKISKDTKMKKDKTEKEKPIDSPVHEQYKLIRDSLEMEFIDHDGQSERPGGAVLSLTLGLIVTAALAVLVGCRMRTVSRRVRRGGKAPYAHDADFLVNGMYL